MTNETEHENRVLGGMKATLHNPNTSDEAKEHAAQVLIEHGVSLSEDDKAAGHVIHSAGTDRHAHSHEARQTDPAHSKHASSHSDKYGQADGKDEQHEHRVLGGYKAALANPHTSEEAKEHAREKLEEAGLRGLTPR